MKTRSTLTLVSLLTLFIISCDSNQLSQREAALEQKEQELREKEEELDNKESELTETNNNAIPPSYQVPVTTKKYLYVVIKTVEPKIISKWVEENEPVERESVPSPSLTDGIIPAEVTPHFLKPPKYVVYSKPEYFTYASDIIEVDNFTDDSKYIEQDRFEKNVQRTVDNANWRLRMRSQASGNEIDAEAKIISRQCFVFDSYSEASTQRSADKNVNR